MSNFELHAMAGKSRDRERRASPSEDSSNTLWHKWHSNGDEPANTVSNTSVEFN